MAGSPVSFTRHASIQAKSPLLNLPAEIRLLIFSLILKNKHIHLSRTSGGHAFILASHEPPPDFMSPYGATSFRTTLLSSGDNPATTVQGQLSSLAKVTPIWRTCRLIYLETIDLIYSPANIVSFDQSGLASLRLLLQYHANSLQRFWVHDYIQIRGLVGALGKVKGEEKSYSKQIALLRQMNLAEIRIPTHISDETAFLDVEAEEGRVEQLVMVLKDIAREVKVVKF